MPVTNELEVELFGLFLLLGRHVNGSIGSKRPASIVLMLALNLHPERLNQLRDLLSNRFFPGSRHIELSNEKKPKSA